MSIRSRRPATKADKSTAPRSGPPAGTGMSGFAVHASTAKGATALQGGGGPAARGMPGAGVARGRVAVKALSAEAAALQHLDGALASKDLPDFNRPRSGQAESDFKSLGTEAQPLTRSTLVKFRQYFHQIPVYGSLVTVELDKNNQCLGINSSMATPTGVDPIAKVSPADALETAAKAAGTKRSALTQTPRLYYYFDQHGAKWRLAWIIEDVKAAKRPAGGDSPVKDYVVDGHSGKLLAELPRVATLAGVVETAQDGDKRARQITVQPIAGGKRALHAPDLNVTTYDFGFKDPSAQFKLLPGKAVQAPPDPWAPEAVAAHANGSAVATFLRTVVLRQNIDNKGGELVSSVNCWDHGDGEKPAREWKNAYWNGEQMVYGQILFPDGSFYSLANMLDVVGHEMFHGVTDFTSRLEYRTQAGALNESFSDIFGVIIANWSRPIGQWVWDIGTGFDGPGTALRSMSDPTLHEQPKLMKDFKTATPPYTYNRNDYGWVHDNSGIHNYAAYKLITSKAGSKYLFTKKEVAALFYLALTAQLSRTSQFSDARRAMVQAAQSLFRSKPAATLAAKVKAVEAAYTAAGIV